MGKLTVCRATSQGESTASLAHRYSLTMEGISTVVLGVKNRTELRECIEASDCGPLEPELVGRIELRECIEASDRGPLEPELVGRIDAAVR